MKYLLDINALIALAMRDHQFHSRMDNWVEELDDASLLTCSITELGFVRVLTLASIYGFSVTEARRALLSIKRRALFAGQFIADANDISHLPAWAKASKQVTDAHLVQLAKSNGAILATLDEKIPGSFLIPK